MRIRSCAVILLAASFAACGATRHVASAGVRIALEPAATVVHEPRYVATNAELASIEPVDLSTPELSRIATAEEWRPLAPAPRVRDWNWRPGQTLLQGYLGAAKYTTIERSGGGGQPTDGSDESLSQMPVIGGGGQWKLAGDKLDIGFEGMIGFGWRAGATAFVSSGGGGAVAIDVDLSVLELYGGPFASVMLGDRVRLYGGAGPLMQWAWYDQGGPEAGSGDGFGLGYYARTGLEMMLGSGSLAGVGVRWSDSTVDLSGDQGDLDLAGFQMMFTLAYFY